MARGPSKGSGGRPRSGETSHSGGYKRVTAGPKSKGEQVYAHRAAVGKTKRAKNNPGTKDVVHHKDGSKAGNSKGNLSVKSRSSHSKTHNRKKG